MNTTGGQRKRLLVVTSFWPVETNPIRGIFVVQQSHALLELGCDLTVVCVSPWPETRARPQAPEIVGLPGSLDLVRARQLAVPGGFTGMPLRLSFNTWSSGLAIDRALQRVEDLGDFDGVLVHGLVACGLSLQRWLPRIAAPAIVTLHGEDPYLEASAGAKPVARMLDELWQLPCTCALVGQSLRAYAQKLRVPAEKIAIIHNGTDMPPPEACPHDQNEKGDDRVLLSISRLIRWKGVQLNLRAMAELSKRRPDLNWRYQVIGDGPERPRLEQLAMSLGIHDRVSFLGQLDHEVAMAHLAKCDVFSLPSWREPFGLVYLEAMARRRPVIGCRGAGAEEIARDGVDGRLVEPRDTASLAAALEELLCDPGAALIMGQAARSRASEFSWVANARRYLSHLQ